MAQQYCNAEQADTPKLIPTLAVLCLVSVAVMTPAGTSSATQVYARLDLDPVRESVTRATAAMLKAGAATNAS